MDTGQRVHQGQGDASSQSKQPVGSLTRQAFMLGVGDLWEGVVTYHHSDSDTTHDHILFRISDGRHSVRLRFPVHILPLDAC